MAIGTHVFRPLPALAALAIGLAGVVAVTLARRPPMPSPDELARQRAATPAGMVFVPAGYFWMGTDEPDADEDAKPRRRRFVPSFYIDRNEVTNAEYREFHPEHTFPKGAEQLPVTNLLWKEADAYARWRGGRLPTEAEWEKAARGTDGRRYPWGDDLSPERANYRAVGGVEAKGVSLCVVPGARRGLKPVGRHPLGASPYGALDMAGNAWEWVHDLYEGHPDQRVIRGGAHGYGERALRTYSRGIEGAGVT